MKISPKKVKFCPGCPNNKLTLKKAPQLIISQEKNQDSKVITILGNKKQPIANSLF